MKRQPFQQLTLTLRSFFQGGLVVMAVTLPAQAQELPPPGIEASPVAPVLDEVGEPVPEVIEWPPLPVWTVSELERVRAGELTLGVSLFEDGPVDLAYEELFDSLPEPPPPVENSEEQELFPTTIDDEFLPAYFFGRPASYLVDPQGMLTMQEQRDRQSFLEYHAGDSEIDLYIYLFDQKQHVPPVGEIKRVFAKNFSRGSGLTALIYYYVGAPERSVMVMSPEVSAVVPPTAIRGALIYAKQQAQGKSEPASQLESFSTSLSIRLYWMEQELAKQAAGGGPAPTGSEELTVVEASEPSPAGEPVDDWKILVALGLVVTAILSGGVFVVWWRARQRQQHLFPEMEVSPLLAAPHAAGIGAVIHFGNATLPPSVQKEQVPDYLRQM